MKAPDSESASESQPGGRSDLLVPLALGEDNRLFDPATADRGKSYFCPACREPVILKRGPVRTPHFAHGQTGTCSQETIVHKTAKMLLAQVIGEWKSGRGSRPMIVRNCGICRGDFEQALPEKVEKALVEHHLPEGRIADIALLVGDMVQAAIEIRVTHAVDEAKGADLSVPFIEVDGNAVIAQPLLWRPIADHFRPALCEKCPPRLATFTANATRVAQETGIALPTKYYRYGLHDCWKCGRRMLVYAWPQGGEIEGSAPKVIPRPKTVQYRYSRDRGGKYWANICPHCRSIQGDFYLHSEPEGPFFGIQFEEDTESAFRRDLMRIAAYAAQRDEGAAHGA